MRLIILIEVKISKSPSLSFKSSILRDLFYFFSYSESIKEINYEILVFKSDNYYLYFSNT